LKGEIFEQKKEKDKKEKERKKKKIDENQ